MLLRCSDDTLMAQTVGLFGVHLLTQDYAFLSGLSSKYDCLSTC